MHKPTEEQNLIINFASEQTVNGIVEARAGAAKTTTLEMVAHALPQTDILYLAFNKSVQLEAQERLPDNCDALTLHSLGYRAWAQMVPGRVNPDFKKKSANLREVMNELDATDLEEFEDGGYWDSCSEAIAFAKQCGWVPEAGNFKSAKPLCTDWEFFHERLEFKPTKLEEQIITLAMIISIRQALKGIIDFDDMLYMPAIWPASFPSYSLVMVDEAQDLSLIQHKMLEKLCKKRVVAVGDPCQAIYGFRGAHQDSMERLAKIFEMERHYLTTSFRCPRTVVELAKRRAPDMTFPDWAGEGSIVHHDVSWSHNNVPDGGAIICRNNAPLIRMAFKLLADGRYPELANGDILAQIAKVMKRLGKKDVRRAQALVNLDKWKARELTKTRYPSKIVDQYECMKIFLERTETLGEAVREMEDMKGRSGRIHLTTGHKAKGAEWDTVMFLDPELVDMTEQQDFNLWYVIVTRAKQTLIFATSDTYVAERDMEDQAIP